MGHGTTVPAGRVDWADAAKGICIVLVVMMHSALGVEAASGRQGWLHAVVEFARPFRMPDFFLISGLFLTRVVDRDWRTYLDRKVVHFAYFYVLWITIQIAVKAPLIATEGGAGAVAWAYASAIWEPFGTLWFIYLLPVFFVATKLTRQWRVPGAAVWLVAAGLEMAHVATGWTLIDEFAARFVYFYTGYLIAGRVFAIASAAQAWPAIAVPVLAVWALLNALLVANGVSALPVVSLAMGYAGALAVVTIAALAVKTPARPPLCYLGRHSIVIYLAFFLPMAAARSLLLHSALAGDIGLVSAITTAAGVLGALIWFWAVCGTRLRFLFERPAAFRLARAPAPPPRPGMQPAE